MAEAGIVVLDEQDFDFVQRNGAWLLSMLAILGSCVAGILGYFLRSRCKRIKCLGFECERDVLDLTSVPVYALRLEMGRRQVSSSNVT